MRKKLHTVPGGGVLRRGTIAIAVLALLLVGALATGSGTAQAQLAYNFTTTTPVVQGGTLTFAVTSPAGATITYAAINPSFGCTLTTAFPASTVTFLCSGGLSAGAQVTELFSVPSNAAAAETVTYNANGPFAGSAAVSAPTVAGPSNCNFIPAPSTSTCAITTTVQVVPTGTLKVGIAGAAGQSVNITSSMASTIGSCTLSPSTPIPTALAATATVTYQCSAGQSVPSGTVVTASIAADAAGQPTIALSQNDNASGVNILPSVQPIPSPTTQTVTAGSTNPNTPPPNPPGGISVNYQAGWNLVGGPNNTVISNANGALYTWQGGYTSYQVVPVGAPLQGGWGYWAYFDVPSTGTLPAVAGPLSVSIPLPPGQWVMIGNPGTTQAVVTGPDAVYAYNPGSGYTSAPTLAPGQGAWAYSQSGTTAFINTR